MGRPDARSRVEEHRPRPDPEHEPWRDEETRQLDEEHEQLPRGRPHGGPAEVGELSQSPGAEPLHKTEEQQH